MLATDQQHLAEPGLRFRPTALAKMRIAGAFVGTLTVDSVKDALISTPVKMVVDWCKDVLGGKLCRARKPRLMSWRGSLE